MIPALTLVALAAAAYGLWTPGATVRDGRHDRGTNALWLQHGWLGDDGWFRRNDRNPALFRSDERVRQLDATLRAHGIRYLYPHLCPAEPDGTLPPVDPRQTERFLRLCRGYRVLPWIGGVLGSDCLPESPEWRRRFVRSSAELLRRYPALAGVHVNIEPMPSGNPDFPILLRELRAALPKGKILSVAAYPPPTRWHPYPEVHWEEAYFRQVAGEVDQLAVMMYDTSIRWPKVYQHVMRTWTPQVVEWGAPAEVLLGVPDYEDAGTGYHHPEVENLPNALRGLHGGLQGYRALPASYGGIAIYSEWQTDAAEWKVLEREFLRK